MAWPIYLLAAADHVQRKALSGSQMKENHIVNIQEKKENLKEKIIHDYDCFCCCFFFPKCRSRIFERYVRQTTLLCLTIWKQVLSIRNKQLKIIITKKTKKERVWEYWRHLLMCNSYRKVQMSWLRWIKIFGLMCCFLDGSSIFISLLCQHWFYCKTG